MLIRRKLSFLKRQVWVVQQFAHVVAAARGAKLAQDELLDQQRRTAGHRIPALRDLGRYEWSQAKGR